MYRIKVYQSYFADAKTWYILSIGFTVRYIPAKNVGDRAKGLEIAVTYFPTHSHKRRNIRVYTN